MIGNSVDDTYELLQVFLAPDLRSNGGNPVIEVTKQLGGKVVCSCQGFSLRGKCEHQTLVSYRLEQSDDGSYPYEFEREPSDEDVRDSQLSRKNYNAFIRKYITVTQYSKNNKLE
jgi:hypothetical protein